MEVAYIPPRPWGRFRGSSSSAPARFVRPVRQLLGEGSGAGKGSKKARLELIGSLEQVSTGTVARQYW